jgi:hypothetical protein
MYDDETPEQKIRVASHGSGRITLEGLSDQDLDKMLAAFGAGAYYVRSVNGEFQAHPTRIPLPKPTEDKELLPFWRKPTPQEKEQAPKLFDLEENLPGTSSASISIQSLCGYNYSPESYDFMANRLTSYGFICLRSRRGEDARFWEIWYLPGLWAAKGQLKDVVKPIKDLSNQLRAGLDFIGESVQFGTLDVSVQRMCMVLE